MGRAVRRVIPNWEHPSQDCPHSPWQGGCTEAKRNGGKCYQPLHDSDGEEAFKEWLDGWHKWLDSEFAETRARHLDLKYREDEPYRAYCDWSGNAPDPAYYRPKWNEGEATWYQLYETVSEGTPVTPPFETEEELVQYLAANGDFWYQNDVFEGRESFRSKPTLEQARSMISTGWAISMVASVSSEGLQMLDPYQQQDLKQPKP